MSLVKWVVMYGQMTAWLLLILGAVVLWSVVRRGGGRPRGFLQWTGAVATLGVMAIAGLFLSWASVKVDGLKTALGQVRKPAAELVFTDLSTGTEHRLSEYRGKVVVVNLWATWCPPCRHEMPLLDSLQQQYASKGLVVLTISDETREAIDRFPRVHDLSMVMGRVEPSQMTSDLYVASKVARPVFHIIDREGVVRDMLVDGQTRSSLESVFKPLL